MLPIYDQSKMNRRKNPILFILSIPQLRTLRWITDTAITAGGNQVTVTWWETNETSAEPLVKTSSENGETFGPAMNLASNGTIGSK